MNVLIIGATGYIGTAVDESLSARGHTVVGVARSDAARTRLQARGTTSIDADVSNPKTLQTAVRAADAVVYTVAITDDDPWAVDFKALRTIGKSLAGSEKTFVYVSSAWIYGSAGTDAITEDAPLNPPPFVSRRIELERASLEMTRIGIRALNVRPGIVYGRGAGIASMFVQSARERGAATVLGEGANRWATIDVRDLGDLIALAVERGRPGRAYNAVDANSFSMREIAEAASRGAGAGGETTYVPPEIMGQYGECLTLDQRISAARAIEDLGWQPAQRSIIDDLEYGSYQQQKIVA